MNVSVDVGRLNDNATYRLNGSEAAAADGLQTLQRIVSALNLFALPGIIMLGTVGNLLSFFVFIGTHLRLQSSYVYLAFLNVADTLFLLCLLVAWLGRINVRLMDRVGWCQLTVYLSYASSFLSVWIVVGFTVERYIVVFHPLKKDVWCTRRRAYMVVLCLAATSLCLYSFSTWTNGVVALADGSHVCAPRRRFMTLMRVATGIDTLITLVVPSVVIIGFNVSMSVKIREIAYKRKHQLTAGGDKTCCMKYGGGDGGGGGVGVGGGGGGWANGRESYRLEPGFLPSSRLSCSSFQLRRLIGGRHVSNDSIRRRFQLRTTRTLLTISSVFLVLNMPSHVLRVYAMLYYLSDATYALPRHVSLCQHLVQMLYYINFAVNFFLYSACSRTFRGALRRLYGRIDRKLRSGYARRPNFLSQKTREAGR